jgi:hypothetical protein
MKSKKEEYHNLTVSWVKIYLEDIEDIINIMKDKGGTVEISDQNFKYESLDDLKHETKTNLKTLQLQSHSPYISLDLGVGQPSGGRLFAETSAEVPFLRIKERLLKRRRWFSFLSSPKMLLSIPIGFLILFILYLIPVGILRSTQYYNYTILFIIISVTLIVFFPLILIQINTTFVGHFASINLEYSDQRQSFWARNKDPIITASIGGIIGALIGGLAIWELSRFFK